MRLAPSSTSSPIPRPSPGGAIGTPIVTLATVSGLDQLTLSTMVGRHAAYYGYVGLVLGAYLALAIAVMVGALPSTTLLAMLSLPLLVRAIHDSDLGAMGQQRAIAKIDLETAQLHATFGVLLVIGLALPGVMPRLVV